MTPDFRRETQPVYDFIANPPCRMRSAASDVERTGVFLISKLIWLTGTCDFTVYSFTAANLVCVGGCARGGGCEARSRKNVRVQRPNVASLGVLDGC
jgi:hypothetical protein